MSQAQRADPGGQGRSRRESAASSRRAARRIAAQRSRRRRQLGLIGGAIALAVVAVLVIVALTGPESDGSASDLPVAAAPPRDASVPQDGHALGDPNAPLTVVEYADFQCPACGLFALRGEPQLVEEYVKTGKVRFVYHDYPFLDDLEKRKESDLASVAAFCAQEQGQFWAFHDILYANQSGENDGAFASKRLNAMAREVGLDESQFAACLASDEYEDDVQQSYDEARELGIRSTPSFVINGQVIVGADYNAIKRAIDAALAGQ